MYKQIEIGRLRISFDSNVSFRFKKGLSWHKFNLSNCSLYCLWFHISHYMFTAELTKYRKR